MFNQKDDHDSSRIHDTDGATSLPFGFLVFATVLRSCDTFEGFLQTAVLFDTLLVVARFFGFAFTDFFATFRCTVLLVEAFLATDFLAVAIASRF